MTNVPPPTTSPDRRRVWLALCTLYVTWGSTYLAIRVMVETIPPLLGAGARFVAAGTVLAVWIVARRGMDRLLLTRRQAAAACAVGTLILFGGIGILTVAERAVPSGLAAVIIASVPLWVVLLRRLAAEPIPRTTAVGVAAGFAGLVAVIGLGERPDNAPLGWVIAVVGAAMLTALGAFSAGRWPLPADPLLSTTVEMLCAGALMVLAGLLVGERPPPASDVSARSMAALGYLVVVGSLVAYTAFGWLLQNAPVSTVATYAYVNPLVALALGWAILSEAITPSVALGAIAVLGSVAFVVRHEGVESHRTTPRPAAPRHQSPP